MIDIDQEGWWYIKNEKEKIAVDKNDFSVTTPDGKINFDAALISLHGSPGEDGKLQGYFDCIGLKYSSCSTTGSALTFNKRYTVAVASFSGINVAKSLHLFSNQIYKVDDILQKINLPAFVKPNNGGSSLGMSKVTLANQMENAILKAFKEDDQVLVEEFIDGREFTIGVYKTKGQIVCLPMTEVKSKNEFFDFEAKYEGKSEETTPANVDEARANKIREAAKKVYQIFDCKGVVRIDFIFNEPINEPFMLEINTVPGQSAASIVPQQVRAAGLTLKEFYSSLIEECFQ